MPNDSSPPIDSRTLKQASVKGAAISVVTQSLKLILLFLNQVVMARLLMPADFGLVAMIAPIMAFVVLFADMGLGQATMARAHMTQEEASFLFWVNLAVSATLAVIVIGLSPLVSWFYHEPRVIPITILMGSTLLISGLYSQQIALFSRQLQYKKVALIDIGALSIGITCGIIAALNGCGYWSLLVVHVMLYLSNLFLAWFFSSWRPSFPKVPGNWKSLIGVGGNVSGFNFVNYFSQNLDNILIGRAYGEVALGLYDRAYKLLLMPLTQIIQPFGRVVLPLLSHTLHEPALYKKAYFRILEVVLLATYPGVLYVVLDHDNVLRTLLGDKWADVGPIFAVLGLGSFVSIISNTSSWLFISQGRTREMRNWGAVSACLLITSFCIGLPWGPLGVATGYFIANLIQGPMICWVVTRQGPVTGDDLRNLIAPYAVSLAVTAIFLTGLLHFAMGKGFLTIFIAGPLSYIIFVSSFMAMPDGRRIIFELLHQAHSTLLRPWMARFRSAPVKVEDEPL